MKRRLFLAIGILALCLPLTLAGSSGYFPAAVDYDGSADYLARGSDLVGNADGKEGLFSCWVRIDGGDGTYRYILANQATRIYFRLSNANKFEVRGRTSVPATNLELITTPTYTSGASWHHLLASWNTATGAFVYVDDAAVALDTETVVDSAIEYTRTSWTVGSNIGGSVSFNGAISEFYFALEYLPINIEANRRLFIDASGNPANLGASGQIPTGTAPIIYMRERANNAGLNFGTGGDFTINGAPTFALGPVPFFPLTTFTPGRGMSSGMRIH